MGRIGKIGNRMREEPAASSTVLVIGGENVSREGERHAVKELFRA